MGITVIDVNNMALCAIISAVIQVLFFVAADIFKSWKITSLAVSINCVVVALLTFFFAQTYAPRQIAITVFVVTWGVRLSLYMLLRMMKTGKGECFAERRCSILISALWGFSQTGFVFAVCLPIIFVNKADYGNNNEFGAFEIVGTVLFCFGLLVETIADAQKFFFRNNSGNDGKFCDVGMWKWSRHPNYFGEIVLWCGIFILSCGILTGGEWTAALSPFNIATRLLFQFGIPLEGSSDKRYGELESYRVYKEQTSPLIPLPPFLYKIIPSFAQSFFCCEFPCYNKLDKAGCSKSCQPTEKTDNGKDKYVENI